MHFVSRNDVRCVDTLVSSGSDCGSDGQVPDGDRCPNSGKAKIFPMEHSTSLVLFNAYPSIVVLFKCNYALTVFGIVINHMYLFNCQNYSRVVFGMNFEIHNC